MKAFLFTAALTALLIPTSAQNTFSTDEQGFIRMLKVLNEVNNWQACARFLRGETPVTTLKIAVTPQ